MNVGTRMEPEGLQRTIAKKVGLYKTGVQYILKIIQMMVIKYKAAQTFHHSFVAVNFGFPRAVT